MSSRPAVDDTALRLTCVRLAIDGMGGLNLLAEAALIECYVRWGKVPIRPSTLSLTWGHERPRTKEHPMPGSVGVVHRGNELVGTISDKDAITGASKDMGGATATPSVSPPEAGELTVDLGQAQDNVVFRAALDSGIANAAVSIDFDPGDGSPRTLVSGSVQIDPDGNVVALDWGDERPRTGD